MKPIGVITRELLQKVWREKCDRRFYTPPAASSLNTGRVIIKPLHSRSISPDRSRAVTNGSDFVCPRGADAVDGVAVTREQFLRASAVKKIAAPERVDGAAVISAASRALAQTGGDGGAIGK